MSIVFISLYGDDPQHMPVKAHSNDACYDLRARCYIDGNGSEVDYIPVPSGGRVLAKTGVFLGMEPGWEALIRPRSGLALNNGITVLNTPGTIDAGYRDEIGVILYNSSAERVRLYISMKIAQIAFREIPDHELMTIAVNTFNNDTDRGINGFGSSGN